MLLKGTRFLSLLLSALGTGLVLSHVLERSPKATLSAPVYRQVQQRLYRPFGPFAAINEPGALLSSLATLLLVRKRRTIFRLTLVGVLCHIANTLLWAVLIRPVNQQVETWTDETVPTNWTQCRDRWENLHAVRAVLSVVGLSTQLAATLEDPSS